MKAAHEARIDAVTDIAADRSSHVLLYGPNIGEHSSPLAHAPAASAMIPSAYPAEREPVRLDVIDSAREVARDLSDFDPFNPDSLDPNVSFYQEAQIVAEYTLGQAGQIQLDPASDNLIVSVFRVTGSTITASERYPNFPTNFTSIGCPNGGGELGWLLYCNSSESKFGTTECGTKANCIVMADLLGDLADVPPNTGIVAVEIYYDYHMTLGLPWITAFLPEDPPGSGKYPITLHAYSFMPNSAAEP